MRDLRPLLGLGVCVVAAIASVVACTDAGGNESGGELAFEGGTTVAPAQEAGGGTGTTWTDLYRDFFGPTGAAKCAGNGQCHGASTQPGSMATKYICPDVAAPEAGPNPAKAQCRETMMGNIIVDPPFSTTSTCGMPFAKAYMHNVIRKATHAPDDENYMPKTPFTYTFSDADVARIDTWVQAGCKDD